MDAPRKVELAASPEHAETEPTEAAEAAAETELSQDPAAAARVEIDSSTVEQAVSAGKFTADQSTEGTMAESEASAHHGVEAASACTGQRG